MTDQTQDKLEIDIRSGDIDSGTIDLYREPDLEYALNRFSREGYRIISLEESVRLRMQSGPSVDSRRTPSGNWTREGTLRAVWEKGDFLVRYSPIIKNPQKALSPCCPGNPPLSIISRKLTDEEIEEALSDSIQIPYSHPCIYDGRVPAKRLGEEPLAVFLFGKETQKYGDFLDSLGHKEVCLPIYCPTEENTCDQMFLPEIFHKPLDWIYIQQICGSGYMSSFESTLRGIREPLKSEEKLEKD